MRRLITTSVIALVLAGTATAAHAFLVGSFGTWNGHPLPSFTPGYQPNFTCFNEYNGGIQWIYNPTLTAGCGSTTAQWEITVPNPVNATSPVSATFAGMQSYVNEIQCQLEVADNWGDHAASGWVQSGGSVNWSATASVGMIPSNALYGVCTITHALFNSSDTAILNFVQL